MNFVKLIDIFGYNYMVNTNHIACLEYAVLDNGMVNYDNIIVSLSNGEAITIPTQEAEEMILAKITPGTTL